MTFPGIGLIRPHAQILRFLISGGTTFLVSIALLYIATEVFGIWYLFSSVVAFVGGFVLSFTMQKFWTFEDKLTHRLKEQISLSLVVALGNLALNTGLMYLFVEFANFYYLFAQVCTSLLIAVESFFVYKHVIFTGGRQSDLAAASSVLENDQQNPPL